jgi:hypothetical protein
MADLENKSHVFKLTTAIKSWSQWCMLGVPATQEAESGGSLKPRINSPGTIAGSCL